MGVTVRQKGSKWYVITHQGRRKAKAIGDRKAAEQVASKFWNVEMQPWRNPVRRWEA